MLAIIGDTITGDTIPGITHGTVHTGIVLIDGVGVVFTPAGILHGIMTITGDHLTAGAGVATMVVTMAVIMVVTMVEAIGVITIITTIHLTVINMGGLH